MFKLIGLELRKNKLSPFIYASIAATIAILVLCFLFGFIVQSETASNELGSEFAMIMSWNGGIAIISTVVFSIFAILSAIMQYRFTVDEYIGKKSILLFSYPVKRKNILFIKCSLVFAFTVLVAVICNLVSILLFALVSNNADIMPQLFGVNEFVLLIKISIMRALFSASVGLVAMRVGFWKKSFVWTVVTSLILIVPSGNLLLLFLENSLAIMLVGTATVFALGLVVFTELLSKVNRMEAV